MSEIHKKVWGYEKWIVNTSLYCGKILYLNKGRRCSLHYHKIKDETFYILEGKIIMELSSNIYLDNLIKVIQEGDVVRIRPFLLHRFTGLTHAKILEISTQHFEEDSYRLLGEFSGKADPDLMKRYESYI